MVQGLTRPLTWSTQWPVQDALLRMRPDWEGWAGKSGQCECHLGREREDWLRERAWTPVGSLHVEPLNSSLRGGGDLRVL